MLIHDGDLHDRRWELKLSHGLVDLKLSDYDQALHNVGGQAQAPEAQALARVPENSPKSPLSRTVRAVPRGGRWDQF